ncbi:hypothetical protein BG0415 [Borreliella bavariensis PBi]|uniref:Uncharacterized protein n=1 Tax=Borrelia garinii subsp. bavariensis (strain ATCC BAA-2496 / DSM 23469 / PBi) TaxID=290434 RepID=A0A7I6GW80_BORGP|nr:hypothetical protein BG0415 [Borreliella bavariensis PBi]
MFKKKFANADLIYLKRLNDV